MSQVVPLPAGTRVLLPGVSAPYEFDEVPENGTVFRGGKFRKARDLVPHDGDDVLPFMAGVYDEPKYDHFTPAQHRENLQHSVAFPPQLADVIGKLRRSAAEMQTAFGKGLPEILGTDPDGGDVVRFHCDLKKIAGGGMCAVMREMEKYFSNLVGGARALHKTFEILRNDDMEHGHHSLDEYTALAHFDEATNAACFLVAARRAILGTPAGGATLPVHGVLYLNNVPGADAESLYNLHFTQVALEETNVQIRASGGAEQCAQTLTTYGARGKCVFLGPAVKPGDTDLQREFCDTDVSVELQVGTSKVADFRHVRGEIEFDV